MNFSMLAWTQSNPRSLSYEVTSTRAYLQIRCLLHLLCETQAEIKKHKKLLMLCPHDIKVNH